MEANLRQRPLDWTAVRFPTLTDRPAKGCNRLDEEGRTPGMSMTLGDAAKALVDLAEGHDHIRRVVAVAS